ncbi:MAG: DUF2568 domain-containing protein [Acidimicrobiales bacterium]
MNATTTSRFETDHPGLPNPYDTPTSAATRFAMELAAWSAGPLAVYKATDSLALAGLSLSVLLAVPALFNAPGDKHKDGPVATPGPARLAIEVGLFAVAVGGAVMVWPTPVAACIAATALAALVSGAPRSRWLLQGAPATTR